MKKSKIAIIVISIIVAIILTVTIGISAYFLSSDTTTTSNEDNKIKTSEVSPENVVLDGPKGLQYVNNQILVRVNDGVSEREVKALADSYGLSISGYNKYVNRYTFESEKAYSYKKLKATKKKLKNEDVVEDTYYNLVMEISEDSYEPPDPYTAHVYPEDSEWTEKLNEQDSEAEWVESEKNNEQDSKAEWVESEKNWGVRAIDAPIAWEYHNAFDNSNVGVVDSLFYEHEDISYSYKSSHDDDYNSHGTHVTGIVAAKHENEIGIAGVAYNPNLYVATIKQSISEIESDQDSERLSALKKYGTSVAFVDAIGKVITQLKNKANKKIVINLSQGSTTLIFSASKGNEIAIYQLNRINLYITDELKKYLADGYDFLIVKAAGNEYDKLYIKDNDAEYGYISMDELDDEYEDKHPFIALNFRTADVDAQYDIFSGITDEELKSRIIVVGSVRQKKEKIKISKFSNRGDRVDVVAPGENIHSTIPTDTNGKKYDNLDGTSMAAPFVTGIASLVMSANPNLTCPEVKKIILETAKGDYEGAPLVNAADAVEKAFKSSGKKIEPIDFVITNDDKEELSIGETSKIEYEFAPRRPTETEIEWRSSDPKRARVNSEGVVTALSKTKEGETVTITGTPVINKNKKPQSKGYVEPQSKEYVIKDTQRDTVLVLDVSGSMGGTPMTEMKEAARSFCEDLLTNNNNDRIALVYYDNDVGYKGFTNDLSQMTSYINGLSSGDSTDMNAALKQAAYLLKTYGRSKSAKNIVIMADGLPNRGDTSSYGPLNYSYSENKYANAVCNTAQSYWNDFNIYSLGFFHSLSGNEYTFAADLMNKIQNKGYTDVKDGSQLEFHFGEIAEEISDSAKIIISIACPVDVSVTYNGETLSSSAKNYNDEASFGTLNVTGEGNDSIKMLYLNELDNYDVSIIGYDEGTMDYSINYYDDNAELTDQRSFQSVPITDTTQIGTNTDIEEPTVLSVDSDGDGVVDEEWKASENSEGSVVEEEQEQSNVWIWIAIVVILLILIVIFILAVVFLRRKKNKNTSNQRQEGYLMLMKDGNVVRTYQILSGNEILAGRSISDSDGIHIPGDGKTVSRKHCGIRYDAISHQYIVMDYSSLGITVNGRDKIPDSQSYIVRHGDVLNLGNSRYSIRIGR